MNASPNTTAPAQVSPCGNGSDALLTEAGVKDLVRSCLLAWLREEMAPTLQEVNDDTPFTSLGLDSVGATTVALVALEVERASGLRVNPDLVYEFQTINQLAGFLIAQGIAVRPPLPDALPPVNGEGSETNTPREAGAAPWFVQRLVERNQRFDGLKAAASTRTRRSSPPTTARLPR